MLGPLGIHESCLSRRLCKVVCPREGKGGDNRRLIENTYNRKNMLKKKWDARCLRSKKIHKKQKTRRKNLRE